MCDNSTTTPVLLLIRSHLEGLASNELGDDCRPEIVVSCALLDVRCSEKRTEGALEVLESLSGGEVSGWAGSLDTCAGGVLEVLVGADTGEVGAVHHIIVSTAQHKA